MSCDEEERGTIKLPTKSFSLVRRAIADAYNKLQDNSFLAAQALFEEASLLAKGKRRPIRWDEIMRQAVEVVEKKHSTISYDRWSPRPMSKFSGVDWDELDVQVLKYKEKVVDGRTIHERRLFRPLKKDFKHASLTENSYTVLIGLSHTPEIHANFQD